MAEAAQTMYPKFVTDGFHIYPWNDEYVNMLGDGRLKPSDPPVVSAAKKLTPRDKRKIEEVRQKALQDAENTVKALKVGAPKLVDLDEVFGSPPKDET